MIRGLFGASSLTHQLRGGLEEVSETHRGIAERVANALTASTSVDFSDALQAEAARQKAELDLQREMTALADTQIRYEADARLLQQAYARLRTAIGNRG